MVTKNQMTNKKNLCLLVILQSKKRRGSLTSSLSQLRRRKFWMCVSKPICRQMGLQVRLCILDKKTAFLAYIHFEIHMKKSRGVSSVPFPFRFPFQLHCELVSSLLALDPTEPVSRPLTQMVIEMINIHVISVQQKR